MKIILIRHGETTGDVEDRYGGAYDDQLTEKGRRQASKLAERLSRKGIEIIYTSTFSRALETARILGKKLDRPVQPIESMRERNSYGLLTGMNKEEARKQYPREVKLLKNYAITINGAESYEAFKSRVLFSLESITKSEKKVVAIVTHGGPISCIIREILRLGEFRRIGDCAFFEIVHDGKYKIMDIENAELEKPPKLGK